MLSRVLQDNNLKYLIIIFLFISKTKSETDIDFCNEKYKCEDVHTICLLKHNCGKGPNCTKYSNALLTDKEKHDILAKHNQLRNKVALGKNFKGINGKYLPSASDMREMVWDKELEFTAQCWANQCPESHDSCRKKTDGTDVGQNLAYNSQNKVSDMVQAWFHEYRSSTANLIDKFSVTKKTTGHYTQMVYSNSTELGCARSKFAYSGFGGETAYFLACNYAANGNILGHMVYKKGKPCSTCPKGSECHKKYKGLCTTKPSKSKKPNICKFSSDADNCKPIIEKQPSTHGTKKPKEPKSNNHDDDKSGVESHTLPRNNGSCIIERKIIVLNSGLSINSFPLSKMCD